MTYFVSVQYACIKKSARLCASNVEKQKSSFSVLCIEEDCLLR